MRKKWGVWLLLACVLLVSACSKDTKEEKEFEQGKEYAQTMVSELSKARLDNRSVESVGDVFRKYEDKIASDVWDNWFDVEMPMVEDGLGLVDKYGFVPVNSDIEKITYGENGTDGYFYTVVATIDAKQAGTGLLERTEGVYFLYEFDKAGDLVDFKVFSQDKENVE